MKKILNSYSKRKITAWKDYSFDIKNFNFNVKYTKIFNQFVYSDQNKNVVILKSLNKKYDNKLFYFDKFKNILPCDVGILPYDTEFYITKGIPGNSVFMSRVNGKRLSFTKYQKYNHELKTNLESHKTIRYLIDKCKDYIVEFKKYNGEIYIINIFNEYEILSYDEIKKLSDYYEIKYLKKINHNIINYDTCVASKKYNDKYFNDLYDENMHEYFYTAMFRNGKYIFCKIK